MSTHQFTGIWKYNREDGCEVVVEDEIAWTINPNHHFEGYGDIIKRTENGNAVDLAKKYNGKNPHYEIKGFLSSFCLTFYFCGIEEEKNLSGVAFVQVTEPVMESINGEWMQLTRKGKIIKGTLTLVKKNEKDKVIILIHGIRTITPPWSDEVKRILAKECNANVEVPPYGYLDIFKFLFPSLTTDKVLLKTTNSINVIKNQYPDVSIYLVGHSFGSFLVTKFLINNTTKIKGVILCGSVVKHDENMTILQDRVKIILNDYSIKDWLPTIAGSITWGYGHSGTFGFQDIFVRNRKHQLPHSGYFTGDFVRKYWVPFFNQEKYIQSDCDESKKPKHLLKFLCHFRLRWIFVLILLFLIYGLVN